MKIINVGMSQMELVANASTLLVAPSLGSCIGLGIYDPVSKVAGMVHIVLPDSTKTTKEITKEGKYADIAIPSLIKKMIQKGAKKERFIVKIAGGAQMFNLQQGSNVLNIGFRNAVAVKSILSKEGLVLRKAETGGNKGRTFKLDPVTGKFYMKIIGQDEIEL